MEMDARKGIGSDEMVRTVSQIALHFAFAVGDLCVTNHYMSLQ
jgi:hypothetical protein